MADVSGARGLLAAPPTHAIVQRIGMDADRLQLHAEGRVYLFSEKIQIERPSCMYNRGAIHGYLIGIPVHIRDQPQRPRRGACACLYLVSASLA